MAPGNLQEALAADSFGSPGVRDCFFTRATRACESVTSHDDYSRTHHECYLFSASVAQANARRCVRPLLDNVDIKAKAYMCVHV